MEAPCSLIWSPLESFGEARPRLKEEESIIQQGNWLRREYLQHTVVGSLVCSLTRRWTQLLAAQSSATYGYDLLIKGGRVGRSLYIPGTTPVRDQCGGYPGLRTTEHFHHRPVDPLLR